MMSLMKTTLTLVVFVLAATLAPSAFAATRNVEITRSGFVPDRLTIDAGDTVTWTNKDSTQHQVVADGGAFPSSPALQPNQTYSYRFLRSGSFSYRDGFAQNERGRITVRQGVTLMPGATVMRFGTATSVSGVVSNGQAGETVTVMAQACGGSTSTQIGTATSAANGAWSLAVRPTANTVYEARWRGSTSAKVEVKVAPRVALVKLGRGRFSARVTAASSLVGKYVVLQRYAQTRRRWVTVKRVVLRTAGAPVSGTITTRATFTSRLRRGTRLRLVLPQSQAGTCYAASLSGLVRA
jgi:plastocyanin